MYLFRNYMYIKLILMILMYEHLKLKLSCSEHLKLGGTPVVGFITSSLNCLIRARAVTAGLMEGILTPSICKNGDPTNLGNYWGVTVTPDLTKRLEHVLKRRHNKIPEEAQSKLHNGFTGGCTSPSATVISTECILSQKTISKSFC